MTNYLAAPIHLDALFFEKALPVLSPSADFSRMPYRGEKGDVHGETGYLSEELLSQPFESQDLLLGAGIHLHWALPDSFHRGTSHGLLCSFTLPEQCVRDLDDSSVDRLAREFSDAGIALSNDLAISVEAQGKRWRLRDRGRNCAHRLRVVHHRKLLEKSMREGLR